MLKVRSSARTRIAYCLQLLSVTSLSACLLSSWGQNFSIFWNFDFDYFYLIERVVTGELIKAFQLKETCLELAELVAQKTQFQLHW